MAGIILYKEGAYNLYDTVSDRPVFHSAITMEQLSLHLQRTGGYVAASILLRRLDRAHSKGCSCPISDDLRDCVVANRAGVDESNLPYEEFIYQFLTLP